MANRGRRTKRQLYWEEEIRKWEKSGLKQVEYCREAGHDQRHFSLWKIKLSKTRKRKAKNKFIEIPKEVISQTLNQEENYSIIIDGNLQIQITNNFNPLTLQNLVRTLKQI